MSTISCHGLRKRYGSTRALQGVSFEANGGCIGLVGPNGAGKTTLLRILAGLARPDAGSAVVAGNDIVRARRATQRAIGYLPQSPAYYGQMTAWEWMRYAAALQGLSGQEAERRCGACLDRLGLLQVRDRPVGGFSGGMKQRLGIAAAIVHRPAILLLDEPVASLDPFGRREMLALVEELHRETTVVVSSHVLEDIERTADRVVILRDGQTVLSETMADLRARYLEPVFECEILQPDLDLGPTLRQLPWVRDVARANASFRVAVDDPDAARRELPQAILATGAVLVRYGMRPPTLEEIFLKAVAS